MDAEQLCYVYDESVSKISICFSDRDLVFILGVTEGCERESITGLMSRERELLVIGVPAVCWLCHTPSKPSSVLGLTHLMSTKKGGNHSVTHFE